jgi:hypothetical protein
MILVGQRHMHVFAIGPESKQGQLAGRKQIRRVPPGFVRNREARPRILSLDPPSFAEYVAQLRFGRHIVA